MNHKNNKMKIIWNKRTNNKNKPKKKKKEIGIDKWMNY